MVGAKDWQFAALIVVLVVVPGAVRQFEALHGRNTAPAAGAAPAGGPKASRTGRSATPVRPPRSC
ncbi:MAG: hypothetical protein ACRD2W_13600 [Acidimicrobiales bacterium]